MKIVFICGSLELGQDGVGDYVRRLGIAIIKQGHQAEAIALNEKKNQSDIIENQYINEFGLRVLRIPHIWSDDKRFQYARKFINDFKPEWISLQFVPYSFNNKGFIFNLGKQLKNLGMHYQWHIMIHELWVGRDENTGWKRILESKLQELLIIRMMGKLSPLVIHTHLPIFYNKLTKRRYTVKELPLFSNIEINNNTNKHNNANVFRVGFFSQAETNEAMMGFLNALGAEIARYNLEFEILLIGGSERHMIAVGEVLESVKNVIKPIKHTGFLGSDEISSAIQGCTIGITPIPRHALGKSGSVAAFMTHGIPVAAPNVHFLYNPATIGFFSDEMCKAIITGADFSEIAHAKNAAPAVSNKIELNTIAKTFLNDLANHNSELTN
ncbi:MAG: hypothetical protein ABIN91_02250 [Mucilaginibacter sp.]|uniref:hypothetical protein n=1 Tax=Mucilaginibacter sp. TaxID=1882438 RepID=UPI003262E07B